MLMNIDLMMGCEIVVKSPVKVCVGVCAGLEA